MKRVTKDKIKRIIPSPALVGSREAYYAEYDHEDIYFVSPAVYELLHDPDVKHIVMKQIRIVDMVKLVGEEYNNLIVHGYDF